MDADIGAVGFWGDLLGVEERTGRTARLWLASLAVGISFDLLFWKALPPGISFPLFMLTALSVGTALAVREGVRPANDALFLLALSLVMSMVPVFRREPLTQFLGYTASVGAAALFTHTYRRGKWRHYRIVDHLLAAAQTLLAIGLKPLVSSITSPAREHRRSRVSSRALGPFMRGAVLAAVLLAIFGALLASADVVFSARVRVVLDYMRGLFGPFDTAEIVFRATFILVISYLAAGAILHALRKSPGAATKDSRTGELELIFPELDTSRLPRLGIVESSISLGSVNVLFAIFVFIQFRYLFGGRTNIGVAGMTYAEYARRGFGELVTVAILSLLLLVAISAVVRIRDSVSERIFSGLVIVLVLFVGIMLLSAFQRLLLYEDAFGFTRARTWGNTFMVWLGLVLVAAAALQAAGRMRYFALAAIIGAVGFTGSLAVLNVDAFIVNHNVRRAVAGSELDLGYLMGLSDDAVPAMADAYRAAPASIKTELGAALACKAAEVVPVSGRQGDWRTFHLAGRHSRRALEGVSADLSSYEVRRDAYGERIVYLGAEERDCSPGWTAPGP